jgi:hypothetical protein
LYLPLQLVVVVVVETLVVAVEVPFLGVGLLQLLVA